MTAASTTTRRPAWRTRRAGSAVAGLALAAALLTACGDGGEEPTPSATGEPTAEPTSPPTATAEPVTVPVYFVVDTRTGLRLARELREVTGDPAVEAVRAMIAGPRDPDYASTWNPDTEVLEVRAEEGGVVVDLSTEARTANVGSEGAAVMIQQLVHTVTAASGNPGPVELFVEGQPAGELWGAVTWAEPVAPAPPVDVRALVQIDTPAEGAEVTSPVTVSGEAAAFEANVPWRVLDGTDEVASGFTMTSEGQTFAPFSFTVELQPGRYTVEIAEDDPSGGAAGTPTTDTKTITVR